MPNEWIPLFKNNDDIHNSPIIEKSNLQVILRSFERVHEKRLRNSHYRTSLVLC